MTQERIEGPTPKGGAYAIVYYLDSSGELVSKERASRFEAVEFDAQGKPIFRTYGVISNG